MATGNIDSFKLSSIATGGLINEDVMQKIFDISKIPLPFTDMIGSDSHKNERFDWTQDELATPDLTNARVDGSDAGAAGAASGYRVGNHSQISDKVIAVSYRADASDTIGRAKELAYRLTRANQEIRRDVEAIALNNQASVAGTSVAAGITGGLPSWIATSAQNGAGGATGGYDAATGLTVARTVGNATALSLANIKTAIQDVYENGGEVTKLMSTPSIITSLSSFMFDNTARVATLTSDQGMSTGKASALGSVNVFVSDFGTIEFVSNRLQQSYTSADAVTGCADVFLLDPEYLSMSYLQGYRTDTLAKTGLSERRQISADWGLRVATEKAHAIMGDIDPTQAVVA